MIGISVVEPTYQASSARHAFVTATQNCHPPPACLQRASDLLDNRCLARASNSQVAHADHENAKRAFAKNSFAIKIKPELYELIVSERECVEDSPQNRGSNAMTTLEHNVDSKLFQVFKPSAHWVISNFRFQIQNLRASVIGTRYDCTRQ